MGSGASSLAGVFQKHPSPEGTHRHLAATKVNRELNVGTKRKVGHRAQGRGVIQYTWPGGIPPLSRYRHPEGVQEGGLQKRAVTA